MTNVGNTNLDASLQDQGVLAPPSPQERLQASRLALQEWIARTYHSPTTKQSENSALTDPFEPSWLNILADSLADVPAATIAMRWVKRWWRHHPWRATVDVFSAAGHELAKPIANKHPWMLLLGSVLAGGLLIKLRPWKWVSGGSLISGLIPQISLTSVFYTILSFMKTPQKNASSVAENDENIEYENKALSQEKIAA